MPALLVPGEGRVRIVSVSLVHVELQQVASNEHSTRQSVGEDGRPHREHGRPSMAQRLAESERKLTTPPTVGTGSSVSFSSARG